MSASLVHFSDADVRRTLSRGGAVAQLERALRNGVGEGVPRSSFPATAGELLLMPSESNSSVGIKVVSVVPGNSDAGLPIIQGVFVLFEGATLRPVAVIDAEALTALRTPAISLAAVRRRLEIDSDPLRMVILGTGAQGRGHFETVTEVLRRDVADVTWASRRGGQEPPPFPHSATRHHRVALASTELDTALARAHLVVCATAASTPLFDSRALANDVTVIAVGSHRPDSREIDAALMHRSQVVVEDGDTAIREAGDVAMAIAEGALAIADLIPMADVVRETRSLVRTRSVVFKSVGMSWQDLVVAEAIVAQRSW